MRLASSIAEQKHAPSRKIGSKSRRAISPQTLAPQAFSAPAVCASPVAGHTALTPASFRPTSTSSACPRTRSLQAAVDKLSPAFTKPWRKLWPHEKIVVASEAAGRQDGLAFTLQLLAKQQETLLCCSDPADHVRRRINREFKKLLGYVPPYGFTFEIAPGTGKLHLHGVLVAPDRSVDDLELLRRALARAGGKITGKASGRQVDLRPITDGVGWAAYSQKDFDTACTRLGTHKVTFLSGDLTGLAQALDCQVSVSDRRAGS